ncbi:hypothetical protein SAMN05443575_0641 [Jatrophihabitans endophyticus]|uniref:Uncharacterized protein n=1 Tax=Jatrophihabitans endophyticus TaxID=1206085 RepID=A0A1M5DNR1_9ACTN|nr:hypothetical protein [Jatrophihabitans endophyticus]SHF68514.1 hypothetical protein SAMN05443575_0641 [Jatrophihabitans endophyticus]
MTSSDSFPDLMARVMTEAAHFGHREHVHLSWLAVHLHGTPTAIRVVSEGIRRTARYVGAPQKYHATVSRAWIECVGHHVHERPTDDFATFLSRNPALLDKRLLLRFYRSATLAGEVARRRWTRPDLAPFPWQRAAPGTCR